jgi:hypothetical protein
VPSTRGSGKDALSGNEQILIRALAAAEEDPARRLVEERLEYEPTLYESLPAQAAIARLLAAPDPSRVLAECEDAAIRTMLAYALLNSGELVTEHLAREALASLERNQLEHRQRELRAMLAAASREGRDEDVRRLSDEKLSVDRALRQC